MLGKLIKNEWRSTWKIPAFINIFLAVFTLFGFLSLKSGIWKSTSPIINALSGLMFVFYVIMLSAVSFVIFIYIAMRFYKNLYTDEGYLMHTLPVTKRALICSKLLNSIFWTILTGIVIIVSIFALFSGLLSASNAGINLGDFFRELHELLFSSEFKQNFGMSFPYFLALFIPVMLCNVVSNILMLYTAISLGQLFQKHKVLGSIVSYIGIYVILQIVGSMVSSPIIYSTAMSDAMVNSFMTPLLWFSLGESIILCIVFFFLTEWLMKKKLNLD